MGSSLAGEGGRPDEARPGIHLRAACFNSTAPWNAERIGALVLYCSDGRWGAAFDEFCHHSLLIPRYDRWAMPGGPICLLPRASHDDFCKGVWQQLDFLVRAHALRRVVLIAHHGCAYYTELLEKEPADCLQAQVDDLQAAMEALRAWFPPGIGVQSYLAMRRGSSLSFHQVGE